MKAFAVAQDVLREAVSRRWILSLAVGVTLLLGLVAWTLRVEVADGALTGVWLMGFKMPVEIEPEALTRPIYAASGYLLYYAGIPLGLIACADLAPKLLAPGRVEHLLALPVRRWELLLGTLLGVLGLGSVAALYSAGGLALILGAKTGFWTAGPLWAALVAAVGFMAIYAAMLASAVFVRSATFSAAVGGVLFWLGVLAGHRDGILELMPAGASRFAFASLTIGVPRISTLASAASALASGAVVELPELAWAAGGALAFALGAFAIGALRFARKDC